jgi:amphi-Trp domain-containing protein
MGEAKFDYDAIEDTESVKTLLQALIEGLEKGSMILRSGDETLEMSPQRLVKFNLKARKRSDNSKLTIKIAWKHPDKSAAADPLVIES